MSHRLAVIAGFLGIAGMALGFGGSASADEPGQVSVLVKLAPGTAGALNRLLDQILAEAPHEIEARSPRSAVVLTDAIGFGRLSADPRLSYVDVISGGETAASLAAGSDAAGAVAFKEWTIRLHTAAPAGIRDGLTAAADLGAGHAAEIVSGRDVGATGEPSEPVGPGTLVIRGLDASGSEVARAVVDDPRLVRYEASAPGGRLTGRVDFLRADVEFTAVLPSDPRIVRIEIAVPESGAGLGLKALATAKAE